MKAILNKKETRTREGLINEWQAIFSYGKTQASKKGIKKKDLEKIVETVRTES